MIGVAVQREEEPSDMSADDERTPYAGPGDETTRRRDLPEEHTDAEEFVETVDETADEHLSKRVSDTMDDQPSTPPGPPDETAQ